MAINFRHIPPNIRVPLAFFEVNNERAATFQIIQNAVLLGTVADDMPLRPNHPTLAISAAHVQALTGPGSAYSRQAIAWFANNASVPLYLVAAEETGFTVGIGHIAWTTDPAGGAPGSGVVPLYIGNRLVRIPVAAGDTAAQIAQTAANAINTNPLTGIIATVGGTGQTNRTVLTGRQAGILGEIDFFIGLAGVSGISDAEVYPPGVTWDLVHMADAGGTLPTGSPTLEDLLPSIGDMNADFIISPYFAPGDLDALDTYLNDITGRWSWSLQKYGHAFTAVYGTVGGLSALGRQRNGQHVTIFGFNGGATPPDEWLTAYVGQAAGSLIVDPARPCQALPLFGVRAPPIEDAFSILERQVLYFDGISSYHLGEDGTVYINRLITTYRLNQWGAPDNSYLDVETLYTAAYYNRYMHQRISTKFPRHKLANDGTRFGAGQAIVTPRIMRAEFIAAYGELMEMGIVENIAGFERDIIVERDAQDPNRLNVLAPPDWINQLRIAAVLVQFRLMDVTAAGRAA